MSVPVNPSYTPVASLAPWPIQSHLLHSEARTPWHQPTLVGFSLDQSLWTPAPKPLNPLQEVINDLKVISETEVMAQVWPQEPSPQHITCPATSLGPKLGELGKKQPGLLLSCPTDVNSEDWQTTKELRAWLYSRKMSWGPLTNLRGLCLWNAGDRADSPCPTTVSVWHTWLGELTNWKYRSKCKRILSIALLHEEFHEMFPFARFIEKFFKFFTKASLFCTREVSQCGKEEKYLCWVCHTASERDLFLLFKVWLSYYPVFHQVLNENKSSKAGRQSNYLDHTNMLSDGEGCTCWGWRTWFPACPCLMWMGWVILGKSFHTLEFSSSTK